MSRLGKKAIEIPEKTEVTHSGDLFVVKGPLGQISFNFKNNISIEIKDKKITLKPLKEDLESMALWGTYASHLKNMIKGVNELYQKKLIIEGIGFKCEVKGSEMILNLGFSHPIKIQIPNDIKVKVEKNIVIISGVSKELVGQFSAKIRELKKPEPYKGKGIRYEKEVIRRKQGKKAV